MCVYACKMPCHTVVLLVVTKTCPLATVADRSNNFSSRTCSRQDPRSTMMIIICSLLLSTIRANACDTSCTNVFGLFYATKVCQSWWEFSTNEHIRLYSLIQLELITFCCKRSLVKSRFKSNICSMILRSCLDAKYAATTTH